jgi:membrane-bound lytic murein transglycosylase MltF
LVLLGLASGVDAPAQTPASKTASQAPRSAAAADGVDGRELDVSTKVRLGDFDAMLERRAIRFYVPYSRSIYFVDKGRERGIAADLMREFERWVNKKYAKSLGQRPITVFIVVATRDRLRDDLLAGRADVAVGNIKVLDELLQSVDFVAPDENIAAAELLVTGPASPAIASIDDLAGQTVHVRAGSSQELSLKALNERFRQAGKPEFKAVPLANALEDEDLLEMLNAGVLQAIVVDDWKARMWAQVLPKVKIHENIELRPRTKLGWAIRKGSPKLAAELNEFHAYYAKQQGGIPKLQREYMSRVKAMKNATAGEDHKRFVALIEVFKKYGRQYNFEPMMLAAQGYQESSLNQQAKSPVGAIGIMQLMPATGAELGVGDIQLAEPNIHGGAKYMDQLMTRYFKDANFDEQNRTLFAFASYNCGPGNVSRMRKEAAKRGLDPDQWFNNVEIVTAEKIGIETTTYVRNIFKYYAAYKLPRGSSSHRKGSEGRNRPIETETRGERGGRAPRGTQWAKRTTKLAAPSALPRKASSSSALVRPGASAPGSSEVATSVKT